MIGTPLIWVFYILLCYFLWRYSQKNNIPQILYTHIERMREFIPIYTYMAVFIWGFAISFYVVTYALNKYNL